MSLTPEFRKMIEENIHTIVMNIPTLKQEYPKLKQEWKFEHDFDFIYGSVIGQILGSALSTFKILYRREATNDEMLMIGEIVESYFPLIRETISTS
ncbi:MAG: hypothetical protein ACREAE_09425 [Nitrosopumilaceae archaeon]